MTNPKTKTFFKRVFIGFLIAFCLSTDKKSADDPITDIVGFPEFIGFLIFVLLLIAVIYGLAKL